MLPLIIWNETIALGILSMDTQHQRWIGLINELYEAMRAGKQKAVVGRTLTSMLEYTQTHFVAEEKLMATCDYPEYKEHKLMHEEFTKQVEGLSHLQQAHDDALTFEIMNFLKEWLVNHIQKVDRLYVTHLKSRGVR